MVLQTIEQDNSAPGQQVAAESSTWCEDAKGRSVSDCQVSGSAQEDDLKKAGYLQGGVLTPASAMGSLLIDRLRNAGLKFEIEDGSNGSRIEE